MMKKKTQTQTTEQVSLYRGGSVVSSLCNAFGSSLKETRLTALLGYVISLSPDTFAPLLGFRGKVLSVALETNHDADRSDILIQTTNGTCIIEAKVSPTDPINQISKYPAKWHTLLTPYVPSTKQKLRHNITYVTWKHLAKPLSSLAKSKRCDLRFLASDLIRYMGEHRMIRTKDTVEIYARELNDESTLSLFLHGRMYGSIYKANTRLTEALYFAPHFGQKIANEHVGIGAGISYIAKIEDIETVESGKELKQSIITRNGKHWYNKHKAIYDQVCKTWSWEKDKQFFFLFLGQPRLTFNPPVQKDNLQKGKGYLSKHFLSFDELFKAWGC